MYTATILTVGYGCKTWSLKFKQEQKLRMFENKVLKKTFEGKRAKVTEEWWRFYLEQFHDLKFSPINIRVNKSRST